MSKRLTPVESFATMISNKDNISVQEWNDMIDKANELFKDAIYAAFENGKECGMQIEASYNEGKDYHCISDGMRYYEKEFGGENEQKAISETASTNTAKGIWVKHLKIQGGNNDQQ